VNQAYEAVWQEMQREIAGMSTRGQQIIAQESGHMIHHQQPELVVREIQRMVEIYRGRTGPAAYARPLGCTISATAGTRQA